MAIGRSQVRIERGVVYVGTFEYYGPGWWWHRAPLVDGRARCVDTDNRVIFDLTYDGARLMHYTTGGAELATDDALPWRRGCLWLVKISPTYDAWRAALVRSFTRIPEAGRVLGRPALNTPMSEWRDGTRTVNNHCYWIDFARPSVGHFLPVAFSRRAKERPV